MRTLLTYFSKLQGGLNLTAADWVYFVIKSVSNYVTGHNNCSRLGHQMCLFKTDRTQISVLNISCGVRELHTTLAVKHRGQISDMHARALRFLLGLNFKTI